MLFARQPALRSHFGTPLTPSTLFPPLVTSYHSPVTNSLRIRTSEKRTRNPFRFRTSKTQHLKPFRMNTYKKTGEGVTVAQALLPVLLEIHCCGGRIVARTSSLCSPSFFLCESSVNSTPLRYLFSSSAALQVRNTHEHPQPLSPHGFTSQLADTPGAGGPCSSSFLSENFRLSTIDCQLPFPLTQSASPNIPSPRAHPPSASLPKSPARSSPPPRTSSLSTAQ